MFYLENCGNHSTVRTLTKASQILRNTSGIENVNENSSEIELHQSLTLDVCNVIIIL